MQPEDRQQIEKALREIPRDEWERFFASAQGQHFEEKLSCIRQTLKLAGLAAMGPTPKPVAETIDMLGTQLLNDRDIGGWLREALLRTLSNRDWEKLVSYVVEHGTQQASAYHGNMKQHAGGAEVLADGWRRGTNWARLVCETLDLPAFLAHTNSGILPADTTIEPVVSLPALHKDFQLPVYKGLRTLLRDGQGKTALLSLPTGAGKTRVTVEAICDFIAEDGMRSPKNIILWIAQSDELLRQAWECFRQVWQVPPTRKLPIRRYDPLRLLRAWGGRNPSTLELGSEPAVVIAGIDQLASWVDRDVELLADLSKRLKCVVIDEAHTLINDEGKAVMRGLGLKNNGDWRPLAAAPLVIGLSATPWRSKDSESVSLRRFFQRNLLTPKALGSNPISKLQSKGFLAKVDAKKLNVHGSPKMTLKQLAAYQKTHKLPDDYVESLGLIPERNAAIVKRLVTLPKKRRVLVFACSIDHAEILAVALNRATKTTSAAVVTGETARGERLRIIEAFRAGKLRYLVNVGVLTAGFDAPGADVVCITRPTTSAVRYEQMVGRGLRGPKNGGTKRCLVLDVQDVDANMPADIQSYGRVVELWNSKQTR